MGSMPQLPIFHAEFAGGRPLWRPSSGRGVTVWHRYGSWYHTIPVIVAIPYITMYRVNMCRRMILIALLGFGREPGS